MLVDILFDILAKILEIFYKTIKYTIKFIAWLFNVAMKDIVISLLSIGILFFLLFSVIIPKIMFIILLLVLVICFVYKFRGKIKNYLDKEGS